MVDITRQRRKIPPGGEIHRRIRNERHDMAEEDYGNGSLMMPNYERSCFMPCPVGKLATVLLTALQDDHSLPTVNVDRVDIPARFDAEA